MKDPPKDSTGAVKIALANGCEILTGWHDRDDPDARDSGDWMALYGAGGQQIAYIESDQWMDPATGRQALSAFLNTCARVTDQT